MNYEFFSQTDTGLVRGNNEDAVGSDPAIGLGVLADGMGGYNAGEVASRMAVDTIASELGRWLSQAGPEAQPRDVRRAMELCVESANRSIFEASNVDPECYGMGTTVVVGVFQPSRLILGHIGDSRCYRWRNGVLAQITRDHSLLQEQLDAGLITPEQASTSLNRNLVTRALGVEDSVMLEVNEHRVEADDLYLMCSDGLSDMLDDGAIASLLADGASLAQKASRLVEHANAAGGRDNISVLLVQAGTGMPRRGIISRLLGK